MKSSSRVIVNTFAQYIRTIITVIVTLYTSRIVLASLGVEDYGIYSLVGGVISMLAFIQNNLSSSTQRFLSYHQGKNDQQMVIKVFNNSVCTQLVISVTLCIFLVLFTEPIFTHIINIPLEKISSAHIVYWLMLVSLFFNMQSTPYLAALIARENIVYSSIIQILDGFIKVPIVLWVSHMPGGRLEWYAVMMTGLTALNFLSYYVYSRIKYDECRHFSFATFDMKLCREMMSFMGWFVYGTACIVGRTQGIAILLNNFFTTAINAAFGIGGQVAGQLSFLSSALTTAFRPRIIKTEGGGNRQKMFRLSEISCKFSFLLMSMVTVPAIIHMDDILSLWLKDVPQYASMFCSAFLCANLVDSLTMNMASVNAAIGNVKIYSLFVHTIKLMTVPCAFIALRMECSPSQVMIIYVIFETICSIIRVIFIHYTSGLSLISYFNNVLSPIIAPVIINMIICYWISTYCHGMLILITCCVSVFVTSISTYTLALKKDEKGIIDSLIIKLLRKKT